MQPKRSASYHDSYHRTALDTLAGNVRSATSLLLRAPGLVESVRAGRIPKALRGPLADHLEAWLPMARDRAQRAQERSQERSARIAEGIKLATSNLLGRGHGARFIVKVVYEKRLKGGYAKFGLSRCPSIEVVRRVVHDLVAKNDMKASTSKHAGTFGKVSPIFNDER